MCEFLTFTFNSVILYTTPFSPHGSQCVWQQLVSNKKQKEQKMEIMPFRFLELYNDTVIYG